MLSTRPEVALTLVRSVQSGVVDELLGVTVEVDRVRPVEGPGLLVSLDMHLYGKFVVKHDASGSIFVR